MGTGVQTQIGRIVWHELMSTDAEAAKRFYSRLLGWEIEVWKPGEMDYAMVMADGQGHGGFHQIEEGQNVPSHWMAYVCVEDVDATVGQAERRGGKVLFGPMDIAEVGRFAVIADPEGAAIAAFTPEGEEPAAEGIFVWDELLSRDVEGARRFYPEVFSWTAATMDMGGFGEYTLFKRSGGEADAGGVLAMPPGVEAPPHWLTYLGADDVDATVEKARSLGATVMNPGMDIGTVGRIAVVIDPTGAVFGLFKPAA
jgi:uncharacterized protein